MWIVTHSTCAVRGKMGGVRAWSMMGRIVLIAGLGRRLRVIRLRVGFIVSRRRLVGLGGVLVLRMGRFEIMKAAKTMNLLMQFAIPSRRFAIAERRTVAARDPWPAASLGQVRVARI